MTAEERNATHSDSHEPRFQYSLATLLVVTIVVAIACAVFFAFPVWVGIVSAFCLVIFTPVALTMVAIYRPGYARTFCLGALFPAGIYFVFFGLYGAFVHVTLASSEFPFGTIDDSVPRTPILILLAVYCTLVILGGLLAVFVRWRLEAPRRRAARERHGAEDRPDAEPGSFDRPERSG